MTAVVNFMVNIPLEADTQLNKSALCVKTIL